ncbi:hypothetical protein GN244_ATG01042 [Phytophthora infestans]|uniref:Uncharacterized protein n=1 Tax=Phytophthora infestans TaxID=4787 RepID=A0A833SVT8_PHYIN|nr:hypothetical protein GN244_ATG01042 [Phytophthora infestans]
MKYSKAIAPGSWTMHANMTTYVEPVEETSEDSTRCVSTTACPQAPMLLNVAAVEINIPTTLHWGYRYKVTWLRYFKRKKLKPINTE